MCLRMKAVVGASQPNSMSFFVAARLGAVAGAVVAAVAAAAAAAVVVVVVAAAAGTA
jgi:hypothetical protein